jgi:hypothetical protein
MGEEARATPAPASEISPADTKQPNAGTLEYTDDPGAALGDALSALVELLLSLTNAVEEENGG